MINGIILGIVAMLCFGTLEIFLKKVVMRLGTYSTVLYRGLLITLMLIAFAIINYNALAFSVPLIFLLSITAVFGLTAFFSFTHSLTLGKISIVSPVAHGAAVITVLLAALFLKEPLTSFQGFAILLIILGTVVVSFKWTELKHLELHHLTKGIPYALLSFFTWGITMFLFKISIDKYGALTPALLLDSFMFFFLLILVPFKTFPKPNKQEWKQLFLISLYQLLLLFPLLTDFLMD